MLIRALLFSLVLIPGFARAAADITVERDIPYLGPDRDEKLDAYLPADSFERPVPAVLLIHGGGWRLGDKADRRERGFATTLAQQGYAVFSINYRLNQGARNEHGSFEVSELAWPQNLYDCKSALRFIRKEADRFGIDPDRIAVMGGSQAGTCPCLWRPRHTTRRSISRVSIRSSLTR